jgi:hypothetical protein
MGPRSQHKRTHGESGENADKKQIKAFRKAARELGCDDNEDRFKAALRTVAKAKRQPQEGKRARSKVHK